MEFQLSLDLILSCFANYISEKHNEETNKGARESSLVVLSYLLVIGHGFFLLASPVVVMCFTDLKWGLSSERGVWSWAGAVHRTTAQISVKLLEKTIRIPRKWIQKVGPWKPQLIRASLLLSLAYLSLILPEAFSYTVPSDRTLFCMLSIY